MYMYLLKKNLLDVKQVIFIVYYYCTMLHILAQIIQRWFADMHKPPFCKYWKIKKKKLEKLEEKKLEYEIFNI